MFSRLGSFPRVLAASIVLALGAGSDAIPASAIAGSPASSLPRSLETLFLQREGKTVQHSSHATTAGAADSWVVPAESTVTIVDHRGAGVIRRWWMTVVQHVEYPEMLRHLIVRCYWDDEPTPSVEAPLADFFGLSFGEVHDYASIPVSVTSGGLNCYWPMPFHRHARITIENRGSIPVSGLFFNVGVESSKVPDDALYFHAQFRRVAPTVRDRPVVVLEATGSGQYVGTVLSARTLRGKGPRFLEGNERFFVDGEREASMEGTGTEDYFSGGLYFANGTFAAPYHGVTVLDRDANRVGAYRWHIPDPISFSRSFRLELQHGYDDNAIADYATTAFWYQTHPHAPFPGLPDQLGAIPDLPTLQVPGMLEGEKLRAEFVTKGQARLQSTEEFGGSWSGDAQLLWTGGEVGSRITLFIEAPEEREYELIGYFTRGPGFGNARISVARRQLGIVDGFDKTMHPSGARSFGRVPLKVGPNELLIEITGKDPRASGYAVGVDGFRLGE